MEGTEPCTGSCARMSRTSSRSNKSLAAAFARACLEARTVSATLPMNKPSFISSGSAVTGRVLKFAIVGGVGVAINLAALYVLSRWAGLPLVAASALAVELAAISNYLLNDTWTFGTRSPSLSRFAKFNVASLVGMVLNVLCVWLLTRLGLYFLVANLIGITAGFATNYTFSVSWVWAQTALCAMREDQPQQPDLKLYKLR
jgi:putative flippase GtrA